jgi:hypothetical protein
MAKLDSSDIDLKIEETFGGKTNSHKDEKNEIESGEKPAIDPKEEKKNAELERAKWRSRRKMAWLALFAEILVTIALFIVPIEEKRVSIISEPIIWFYFSMTSVIGFYMGATTWAYVGKGRGK